MYFLLLIQKVTNIILAPTLRNSNVGTALCAFNIGSVSVPALTGPP